MSLFIIWFPARGEGEYKKNLCRAMQAILCMQAKKSNPPCHSGFNLQQEVSFFEEF